MARDDDDAGDGEHDRGRALWSGVITFGLVSVPVELYPGVRSLRHALRMLDEEGNPLARRYCCPEDGAPVDADEIARGYEVEEGRYVVVTDAELEAAEPKKSREIDLRRFVDPKEISPLYYRQSYYLVPAEGTNKAYRLLASAMEKRNRAGIATFVMRGTEYVVAIIAERGILRGDILRFQDEVRSAEDIGLPPHQPATGKAVKALKDAVERRTKKELDPRELEEDESRRLVELAEEKAKHDKDVVRAAPEAEPEENVVDLVQLLKQRLAEGAPAGGSAKREARGKERAEGDLSRKTKQELYDIAKERGIEGRSRMDREQMIKAIRKVA